MTISTIPDEDIFPVLVIRHERPRPTLRRFTGTSFLIGPRLLVSCWHCVCPDDLKEDEAYAVAFRRQETGAGYGLAVLRDIKQHPVGFDLASAMVDLVPTFGMVLASEMPAPHGTNVWSFGYPLPDTELGSDDAARIRLHPRYLEGYLMRAFRHQPPGYPVTPAWELDMPTPAGLSGAPLVRMKSKEVIGVVYGSHAVETIEEISSRNSETGTVSPEIVRQTHFGLAHYLENLHSLSRA